MIDPDFFGCSGKLPFNETQRLSLCANGEGSGGDFSSLAALGPLVTSIDRVHRCARDWDSFARIALNHAFGDVVCAGAKPVQAMLSFEFGADTPEHEYAECSAAFARALAERDVALGKCHSGRSDGVTAVTIATLAANPSRLTSRLETGSIYLSRPIGALKVHYLAEMERTVDKSATQRLLEVPDDEDFRSAPWSLMTDVSGHGLLGAAVQVAQGHALKIELNLSADHAIGSVVLTQPAECLQNPADSYGFPISNIHPSAALLVTLRETAGPYLGFIERGSLCAELTAPGILLGHYQKGDWKVGVKWIE